MNNYIILSSKPWNIKLADQLKKTFQDDNWFLINNKKYLTIEKLNEIQPEFIFIPHWSNIIPEEIFLNYRCIVFHMTDLPFGRGGSPLQNLIAKKHDKTKISAIQVVKELDAGPVYLKKGLSLLGTAEEIFIRANSVIAQMIEEIMTNKLEPREQEGTPVNFKRRTPEMSSINEIKKLDDVYDHIRMLDAEGYPKAVLENQFFKFEFSRASLKSNETIIADVRITKK